MDLLLVLDADFFLDADLLLVLDADFFLDADLLFEEE
jgi:hypothetical protein